MSHDRSLRSSPALHSRGTAGRSSGGALLSEHLLSRGPAHAIADERLRIRPAPTPCLSPQTWAARAGVCPKGLHRPESPQQRSNFSYARRPAMPSTIRSLAVASSSCFSSPAAYLRYVAPSPRGSHLEGSALHCMAPPGASASPWRRQGPSQPSGRTGCFRYWPGDSPPLAHECDGQRGGRAVARAFRNLIEGEVRAPEQDPHVVQAPAPHVAHRGFAHQLAKPLGERGARLHRHLREGLDAARRARRGARRGPREHMGDAPRNNHHVALFQQCASALQLDGGPAPLEQVDAADAGLVVEVPRRFDTGRRYRTKRQDEATGRSRCG
jgi:hypothetical protein